MKKNVVSKLVVALLVVVVFLSFSIVVNAEEYGTAGRLVISAVSIDVPLWWFDSTSFDSAQAACDAVDSAAYLDHSDFYGRACTPIIADHCNQGFDGLYQVIPDETIAEIRNSDGSVSKFICRENDRNGTNTDECSIDSCGNNIALKYPSNWITIYTCNPGNWRSITVTFWEPVD